MADEQSYNDISDVAKDYREKDLDAEFDKYKERTNDKLMDHMQLNVFTPAQDELYDTLTKKVNESFKEEGMDDEDVLQLKLSKKKGSKEKLYKAVNEALLAYFKKCDKTFHKHVTGLEHLKDDHEKMYEKLMDHYDRYHVPLQRGEEKLSLRGKVEATLKNPDMKISDFYKGVKEHSSQHAEKAVISLKNQALNAGFGSYHPHELQEWAEEYKIENFKIKHPEVWNEQSIGDILGVVESIEKKLPFDHKSRGLEPEKAKK